MSKSASHLSEFELIDWIRRRFPETSGMEKGIGDDTAVIRPRPGMRQLVTTDMLIEGVHFDGRMDPHWIGHKALACSISDICAMGGAPRYAVLSLGCPAHCATSFIQNILDGLGRLSAHTGIGLIGGDTVRSPKLVINVCLIGEARPGRVITRCGARPGDRIFVTGALGGSLKSYRHLTFQPRFDEAQYLVRYYPPHAMIDISDGLVQDLDHILSASGVGAVLDDGQIPRHRGAAVHQALYDGEDYELCFTLPKARAAKLEASRQKRFRFTRIGEIRPRREGFRIRTAGGALRKLDPQKGYRHF